MKIGLVDDSGMMRKLGSRILTGAGHEVVLAPDGYDSLSMIVENDLDCLFLDVEMEIIGGLDACRIIKSSPKHCDLPIIILSSRDGEFDKAKGKLVGAELYITKPFNKESLLEAIKVIGEKR